MRDSCDLLASYLPRLARLLHLPDSPAGYADTGMTGALAHSPVPGNAGAFHASTGIHALARWWEAMLLYHHGGTSVWGRRGGSDANTLKALEAVVRLAAGADDDVLEDLARDLRRAEADAGAVPAIDEAERWRRLPGRACPFCGCWRLMVLLDARERPTSHVCCFGHDGGVPCRQTATAATDASGRPALRWASGLVEAA